MRALAGAALLALYPEPWRGRYGEEMRALMDDDPPTLAGLASLLVGAARAHVRPGGSWRARATPHTLMRLSVGGTFCCWMALSVAGVSFQKETEEATYAAAERQHWPLAVGHGAVMAGAALGACAIAYGGVPLLWLALRRAWSTADRRLALLLGLAPAAVAAFALLTRVVMWLAPANVDHTSTPAKLALLLPWYAGGAACVAVCALAPRAVMARSQPPLQTLRRATAAGRVLVVAMLLVTTGLAVYVATLATTSPQLSGESGGPIWPSTGLTLGAAWGLAFASTALARVAAARAVRAARLATSA